MRTLTAQEEKVLKAAAGYRVAYRVLIADTLVPGAFLDLTALEGVDWCEGVDWSEDLDSPASSATVSLRREVNLLSLSPLVQTSKINLRTGTYVPLIRSGAAFIIQTATLPLGIAPVVGDWREVFRGRIDEVDAGKEVLTFVGRDLIGILQDTFIETVTEYSNAGVGVAVETIMASILTASGFTAPTYNPVALSPGSPGWMVRTFSQEKAPTFDALSKLATELGWDLRMKWSTVASAFVLTLIQPDRAFSGTPAWEWTQARYTEVGSLRTQLADVRNAVEVTYPSITVLDSLGNRTIQKSTATDATSITKYGRRWMQFELGSSDNINTSVEASALAANALADLKEPLLEKSITASYLYAVELNDVHRLKAHPQLYSADQDLAVVGISHSLKGGGGTTSLTLRGKPQLAPAVWLTKEARPGAAAVAQLVGPNTPGAPTATAISTGIVVTFVPPQTGRPAFSYQLHLSTTAGFTPSAATLREVSDTSRFEVTGLTPGVPIYARVIPVAGDGTVGNASVELTATPTYYGPGLLLPAVDFAKLPPNADFEAHSVLTAPPDTWTLLATGGQTWGVHAQITTDSRSGSKAILFPASAGALSQLTSQRVNISPGNSYLVDVWFKSTIAGYDLEIALVWLNSSGGTVTTYVWAANATTANVWQQLALVRTAPAGAAAVAVYVRKSNNVAAITVDAVELRRADFPQEAWAIPTVLLNGWNYGATFYHPPQFRKDFGSGRVWFRGAIKNPSGAYTIAFQLPTGYRPLVAQRIKGSFGTGVTTVGALIDVYNNGDVAIFGHQVNDWVNLDGLSITTD